MNTLILERCVLCGDPVRKPGELLCIRHDVQALIILGYYRMIEKGTAQRLKRRQPKEKVNYDNTKQT